MNYSEKINTLKDVISSLAPDPSWATSEAIDQALDDVKLHLEEDIAVLEQEAAFIFSSEVEVKSHTRQMVDLLRDWHMEERSPSLSAIACAAIKNFGLEDSEEGLRSILMASVLGEVKNSLAYHNNMHYRIVLLQIICLIVRHNSIYADTSNEFDKDQIAMLMISACIHDLGHDGQGNTVNEIHMSGRLEKRAFQLARPYLMATGYNDGSRLADIRTMLVCTDVSPLYDPNNPASQMKAVYKYHYQGGKGNPLPYLSDDLSVLADRPDVTLMGLILHEADIAASAGLEYSVTKFETRLYRDEIAKEEAGPQHVLDFLDEVCQRQMLSGAGQKLYAGNLARICALAEEGVKNGNKPFTRPEDSEFLSSAGG
ncbi:MAG: hypothetical protein DHS20C02_02650 [Micavibrio sp.]|nr:MAG: hypothetical protein DHS20C02_02650 [Micavibrio sp.]